MDRNPYLLWQFGRAFWSLSARRAWIEIMGRYAQSFRGGKVALRKESVDRNSDGVVSGSGDYVVALRKESVDRNTNPHSISSMILTVALRKESVDRNLNAVQIVIIKMVALRKESVDRNSEINSRGRKKMKSLSARRAWIEIVNCQARQGNF